MPSDTHIPSLFRLEFGTIDAGWIEAKAQLGEATIKTKASWLGEPFAEWVSAILELNYYAASNYPTATQPARACVDWNKEPSVHRFTLEITDPSFAVKVSCLWAADPPIGRWERHDRDFGSVIVPWADLAAEVCRAARVVYRRYGLRRYREAWSSSEFPAGRLLELHALRYGEGLLARFPTEHDLLSCEEVSAP